MRIAIRLAYTQLRRRHWKDVSLDQVLEGAGGIPEPAVEKGAEPEVAVQRNNLIEAMYRIIHQDLTEKQRNVLFAELNGMPLGEIGRRVGSNRYAIYKLTHDA